MGLYVVTVATSEYDTRTVTVTAPSIRAGAFTSQSQLQCGRLPSPLWRAQLGHRELKTKTRRGLSSPTSHRHTSSTRRAAAAPAEPFRGVDGGNGERVAARPELLPYNPGANAGASVTSSDGLARFTVLTDRLIRMEQHGNSSAPGTFEDRSTLAMMNRNLPVPSFTQSVSGGVLTISTAALTLTYSVGQAFSAASLQVVSANASSAFSSWSFGQAFPGNLLGTIRGLDGQVRTPLNCTLNAGVDDNGEFNHCEFGMVCNGLTTTLPNFI